jgi:polysaccharide deacetylase 2 family uncharacterized protein YibQ
VQVDDLHRHFIDDITIPSSQAPHSVNIINTPHHTRPYSSTLSESPLFLLLLCVQVDDLHRHFIDDITIPSSQGKGLLRRIDDVFDCWFESGSMPYGQVSGCRPTMSSALS